jgi:hypothetical protein
LWTAICPISGSGLSLAGCQPFCLFSLCLLKVPVENSSLPLPPSLVHLQHPAPSAACSFSVSCLLFRFFFFCCGMGGQSVQEAILVYPRGGVGILHDACLLTCWSVDVSQAGLEPVSGGTGALLFSHCNVAWRSFVWAGGSRCGSFDSSQYFFAAKCGSSVSARLLIYGAHALNSSSHIGLALYDVLKSKCFFQSMYIF